MPLSELKGIVVDFGAIAYAMLEIRHAYADAALAESVHVAGMTPDEYRQRWGLARDYPMTAPAYAAMRSDLAKDIGLGRKPGDTGRETVGGPAASEPMGPTAGPQEAATSVADGVLQEEPAGKADGRGQRKARPRAKRAAPLRGRSKKAKR